MWKGRQRRLNAWTARHMRGVAPLRVDGVPGRSTRRRVRDVRYWLGYVASSDRWDADLHRRLLRTGASPPAMRARGLRRRVAHNRAWSRSHRVGGRTTGIATFDGVRVAAWFVPYLSWARHVGHGGYRWRGRLVSGFRDPAYSERLCYARCGRPSCPGTCAGRMSHHSQYVRPAGAVDVSDYARFGWLMQFCPYRPRIYNSLPYDRVHFSSTGN